MSVKRQRFQDFELIVIDDGSIDNTKEIVSRFFDVRYFYQENKGVSSARNLGIKNAKYDLIAFLDDDDTWHPDKLLLQVDLIKNSDYRIVHCNEIWFKNDKQVNQKLIHIKKEGDLFEKSLHLCSISPSAVLLEKDLLYEMNLFDETMPVCEDYDMWLKITAKYPIGLVSRSLTYKYGGHEQLSRKYYAMDYYRIKSMNNILERLESKKYRKLVIQEILRKSSILLNGHIKHNNMTNFKEIFDIRNTIRHLSF